MMARMIRRLTLGVCLAFAASAALATAPVTLRDNPVDDDGQVTLGELFEGAGAAADIVIARRAGPTVVLDAACPLTNFPGKHAPASAGRALRSGAGRRRALPATGLR